MNKFPKISVIVPVYNAEQYLPRCIDSILSQTFTDFELLMIDDGSTDNSGEICDEYEKKDDRIRVFHKENEGISVTREFGINHVNGQFIQFVDSDDWIEFNMLELMYNQAIITGADIVGCNFIQEYENKSLNTKAIYKDKESFTLSVISNYWGVLWKLLIHHQLFVKNNIHFPAGINGGEDYFVVTQLLLNCNIVSFVDSHLYHYVRYNNTSFISTPSFEKLMYQVKATYLVENVLKKMSKEKIYSIALEKRKVATKLAIINNYFWKGYSLYPELKYDSIYLVHGIKNRLLILFSFILSKAKSCNGNK